MTDLERCKAFLADLVYEMNDGRLEKVRLGNPPPYWELRTLPGTTVVIQRGPTKADPNLWEPGGVIYGDAREVWFAFDEHGKLTEIGGAE